MVFHKEDYNQFIGLLQKNPDWIPELRNLLLSQDFLALPEIVRTNVPKPHWSNWLSAITSPAFFRNIRFILKDFA